MLPVSFHSSEILTDERGVFTSAQLATIALFPLVTIEKWMGSGATDQEGNPVFLWEEAAMVNAAKQVKSVRPNASIILCSEKQIFKLFCVFLVCSVLNTQ